MAPFKSASGFIHDNQLKMSGKIYAIIGLSFLCLLASRTFQLSELKSSLEEQKKLELRHLGGWHCASSARST